MSGKLWGGRFSSDVTDDVLRYTETIGIDERLIRYDIIGSIAHLLMLNNCGILTENDSKKIMRALLKLHDQAENHELKLKTELEDVHLNIESCVIDITGMQVGGRLHTARSRNDQVCLDTRMYLRDEIHTILGELFNFVDHLVARALKEVKTVAVGYTHGQPAQPISLGFWLSAYASMYLRDIGRILNALNTVNLSPLGACALAGTSFPIDRQATAIHLSFPEILNHSLDATSSRDFITETLSAFSALMVNHSRMAEEIVVWSSFEFGLIELSDAFCTGSSIMPQKKNPVVAELAKGRAGRVFGALIQNLTMIKGVATGYNCDLQEDKPFLWDSIDVIKATTVILRKQIESANYNSARATELCWENFSTITELANWLTSKHGIAFRDAHRITGELTQHLLALKQTPRASDVCASFLQSRGIDVEPTELLAILDPFVIMTKQNSLGGTSPGAVRDVCDDLRARLERYRGLVNESIQRVSSAEATLMNDAKKLIEV